MNKFVKAEHDLQVFIMDVKSRFGGTITTQNEKVPGSFNVVRTFTLDIGNDGVFITARYFSDYLEGPMTEIIYQSEDFRFFDNLEYIVDSAQELMELDGYYFELEVFSAP